MQNTGNERTQLFRNQIRRRNIDELFKKKRLQFAGFSNLPNSQSDAMFNTSIVDKQISQITMQFENNQNHLNLNHLKRLVMMSQDQECLLKIKKAPFVKSLGDFLSEQYTNQEAQFYATFVLANVFYIIEKQQIQISEAFLQRVYGTLLKSNSKIQQNCLSIIFHIILTLQERDLLSLVTLYHSQSNLISVIHTLTQLNELTQGVVRQILKIFYMLAKRLKFPKNQFFTKMRKIIIMSILSSQNLQIIHLGLLCLSALMNCLPDQCNFSNPHKLSILKTVIAKIESYLQGPNKIQSSSLIFNILKQTIKILNLCSKSLQSVFVQANVLPFLYKILEKQNQEILESKSNQMMFSLIYSLIQERTIDLFQFLEKFNGLFLLSVETFEEDGNSKLVMIELIYLMGLFYGKGYSYSLHNERIGPVFQKIRVRFRQLLDKNQYELQPNLLDFIEQTLSICNQDLDF